jgi:hypothetical protein
MKAIFLALFLITALSFSTNEEKSFSVKFTVNDWQSKINMLAYTKAVLRNSSLPANVALPLCDSLDKFQSEIIAQIQGQLKPDSTGKRK